MAMKKSLYLVKREAEGLVALVDADQATGWENRKEFGDLIYKAIERIRAAADDVLGGDGKGTTSTVNILFKSTGADEVKATVQEIKKELQECVDLKAKLEG